MTDPVNDVPFVAGDLLGRQWQVVLGIPGQPNAYEITDLDVEFRATRSLKPEPNTVELTIFNMNAIQRAGFGMAEKNTLLLRAGYKGTGVGTIFQGEVRQAFSRKDGVDWRTTVRAGDGGHKIKARIALTFGLQVSTGDALSAIARKMGVKPGNLQHAVSQLKLKGVADLYPMGGAVVGNGWREMQNVARSAGLEVSIQDGALQFLDLGQPMSEQAVLVSPETGMVDSPEINADGRVVVNTLMIPTLKPGVKIDLQSANVRGGYRVIECEYTGQSRGSDWYIQSTCERY